MQATTAQKGTFTHTPRPAITSDDKHYRYQRRFGRGRDVRDHVLQPSEPYARSLNAEIDVYRDGETDLAEVRMNLGLFTSARIAVRRPPDACRTARAGRLPARRRARHRNPARRRAGPGGSMTPPTLRPYRINAAGLEYIALATGPCAAIADAMALHGAQTITAKPLRLQGGAA